MMTMRFVDDGLNKEAILAELLVSFAHILFSSRLEVYFQNVLVPKSACYSYLQRSYNR